VKRLGNIDLTETDIMEMHVVFLNASRDVFENKAFKKART
jgi:hypothetical protein